MMTDFVVWWCSLIGIQNAEAITIVLGIAGGLSLFVPLYVFYFIVYILLSMVALR